MNYGKAAGIAQLRVAVSGRTVGQGCGKSGVKVGEPKATRFARRRFFQRQRHTRHLCLCVSVVLPSLGGNSALRPNEGD
jgi:hypothetical protein